MNRIVLAAIAALGAFGVTAAHAQTRSLDAAATPGPATLDQFRGMVGEWTGPLGAASFSPPVAGQIVGHLVLSDGANPPKPRLEELWVFRPDGASVVMSQKIFAADLTGRQDKDAWATRKVVAVEPGHIYLDNFTIAPSGDSLQLIVRTGGQPGAAPSYFTVDLKRVK